MSLTNPIINQPSISASQKRKYTVTAADIAAGGAFTTVDITLDTLPAGSVLFANRIKHSVAVAGTGFSASTARLVFGTTSLGAGALNVFQAPGTTDGTHSIAGTTPVAGDMEDATTLKMTVTSTGGNLSAATAGSIDAYISYDILG